MANPLRIIPEIVKTGKQAADTNKNKIECSAVLTSVVYKKTSMNTD